MSTGNSGLALKLVPEDFSLRGRPKPVSRINRRVLLLLFGTGLILTSGVFLDALDPLDLFDMSQTGRELYRKEGHTTLEGVEQLPRGYGNLELRIKLEPH